MRNSHMHKISIVILSILVVSCATTYKEEFIPASPNQYDLVWKTSKEVVSEYFEIREADASKGTIITYEKLVDTMEGERTEKAVIQIDRRDDGFIVDVSCPIIFAGAVPFMGEGDFDEEGFDPEQMGVGRPDSAETDFRLENEIFSEIKQRVENYLSATSIQ